jgi:hypothetical protein
MGQEETDKTITKREVVKLRARANLLFALLSQSNQNVERQQAELQRRDEELQRIVNSRSWRVTKPLRALARLLGK